jgi:enoyl-CoA hydratase/carnithine racemase
MDKDINVVSVEPTRPGNNRRDQPEAIAMAQKIVDLAPLPLATLKRFVTGHIMPKGPSELAARFTADLATVRDSEDAAEGVRAFEERRGRNTRGDETTLRARSGMGGL